MPVPTDCDTRCGPGTAATQLFSVQGEHRGEPKQWNSLTRNRSRYGGADLLSIQHARGLNAKAVQGLDLA